MAIMAGCPLCGAGLRLYSREYPVRQGVTVFAEAKRFYQCTSSLCLAEVRVHSYDRAPAELAFRESIGGFQFAD
jgi:hypothetical protein